MIDHLLNATLFMSYVLPFRTYKITRRMSNLGSSFYIGGILFVSLYWLLQCVGVPINSEKFNACSLDQFSRWFAVERNVEIHDENHVSAKFRCPVCGQLTTGSYNDNLRDSGNCIHCGASNRFRQITLVINGLLSTLSNSAQINCMNCSLSTMKHFSVYNTQCSGTLHTILKRLPGYICSEFFGQDLGDIVNGTRNEDLQRLSFPENSFDIVISSEVFEHIPSPYIAHSEVLRVLRRGGCHIFSVPFIPQNIRDTHVASLDLEGHLRWASEPILHLDPIRKDGVPVFNIFGIESMAKLCQIGFEVSPFRFHSVSAGILGDNAYIFLACKA